MTVLVTAKANEVQSALNRLLMCFAMCLVSVDAAWVTFGHFAIDARPYLILMLIAPLCVGGSVYYGRFRDEPSLGAMFSATAFLLVVPAACCLLSYLALTISGPRIDFLLAAVDRNFGIRWPDIMAFAGDHPIFTQILSLAYSSIIGQTMLLIFLLGCLRQELQLYGFCLAIAIGALVTIVVWTAFPSFGAYSVYHLLPSVAAKLNLVEGADYGRQLDSLLKNGPGLISPRDLRGIIGFPSYHTVQAIILAWYTRQIPYLRWISLFLNMLVIAATPIHGGHHIADILGGSVVAWVAIAAADSIVHKLRREAPDREASIEISPAPKPVSA